MATRLFVGNLPLNTQETDLRAAFSSYGEICNLDLKSKSTDTDGSKKFAFVTLSGTNYNIESCIKYFGSEDFKGNRLYVTRARESFLERLQRERLEAHQKEAEKAEAQELAKKVKFTITKLGDKLNCGKKKIENNSSSYYHSKVKTFENDYVMHNNNGFVNSDFVKRRGNILDIYKANIQETLKKTPVIKLGDKLNPRKRKAENDTNHRVVEQTRTFEKKVTQNGDRPEPKKPNHILEMCNRKQDSETKRMEAMKNKRKEFKQKQMIVKAGLNSVDKISNKKIIFSDDEKDIPQPVNTYLEKSTKPEKKNALFDEDDDNEDITDGVNFEIKKQFEGKKGQKVLDLQSRYKSDKRFVLDERFIEEEEEEGAKYRDTVEEEDQIEVNQIDEKGKQLDILQDVLGVAIKRKIPEHDRDIKKNKPKIGMLRFDPSQPEHAKFLAPVEDTKQESTKRSKKKTKDKQAEDTEVQEQKLEEPRPEVSKEQFYKVSDTLKETIAQTTSFSFRSLFGNTETVQEESKEEAKYIPLVVPKKAKVKNPLEPGERNPFIYDSSDSETEEIEKETITETAPVITESKAVWKESFFFSISDQRFQEGLAFFTSVSETEAHKERRELKSLMKKRIYNKERKDQMQMFQKKNGGRNKTIKKNFRKN